jgi:hypothetical protein
VDEKMSSLNAFSDFSGEKEVRKFIGDEDDLQRSSVLRVLSNRRRKFLDRKDDPKLLDLPSRRVP